MTELTTSTKSSRITVFGGSRCGPESAEYKEALKLGRLLVEAGFDVCSGGYAGVMEAISRGAHEAGGHVIGVTMVLLLMLTWSEVSASVPASESSPTPFAPLVAESLTHPS